MRVSQDFRQRRFRKFPASLLPVNGIDVNHCKNPRCCAFGLPVSPKASRGRGALNAHTVVANGKNLPAIRCNECGLTFPMKSNHGVAEELRRMESVFNIKSPSCPSADCLNHSAPVTSGKAFYSSFGKTSTGSPRWKCKACARTFSAPVRAIHRQRDSHKNRDVFKALMNQTPLRRICESMEINPNTLYQRINFFHRQSVAFAADREKNLKKKKFERLYLSVDRQDHVINWTARDTKKNTTISALATADNDTGYIFGVHLNFDPDADPVLVEQEGVAAGNSLLQQPHRIHARLWSQTDHDTASKRGKTKKDGTLTGDIGAAYSEALLRDDIEMADTPARTDKLPDKGMLVHGEYTMHGHFRYLRNLFGHVGKFRFFLDQDSGLRSACLSAFADRVLDRTCDAFYVRIAKDLTVDQKRRLKASAAAELSKRLAANPALDEKSLKLGILKERVADARAMGPFGDEWIFMPFPDMSEPEKAVCPMTTLEGMSDDHVARLVGKATLHGVDSFFNRVRRRMSLLERPLRTSSNEGRVWNAYSPYSPMQVQRMLDTFRVVHNFVLVGNDGKTPAMRIGIARGPVDYNDIIYYV